MSRLRMMAACFVVFFISAVAIRAQVATAVTPTPTPTSKGEELASALPSPPVGDQSHDLEFVTGKFFCGSGISGPSISLTFAGTAGITPSTFSVGGAQIDDPAQVCDALRAHLIAETVSRGCTTGQVRNGFSQLSFQFVCSGPRNDMVRTIAALGAKLLAETP